MYTAALKSLASKAYRFESDGSYSPRNTRQSAGCLAIRARRRFRALASWRPVGQLATAALLRELLQRDDIDDALTELTACDQIAIVARLNDAMNPPLSDDELAWGGAL